MFRVRRKPKEGGNTEEEQEEGPVAFAARTPLQDEVSLGNMKGEERSGPVAFAPRARTTPMPST